MASPRVEESMNDPMSLIFLDIDGVMNTPASCLRHRNGERFTSSAIFSLDWLMRRHPQARVVITSTRRRAGLAAMRQLFVRNSLPIVAERITGVTPLLVERDVDDYREDEIELWLESNGPAKRMVILDDKTVTGLLTPHWIGTDPDTGLTLSLAKQASSHLAWKRN